MSEPQAPPGGVGNANLFGEIKRFARTSGAVGGIAARFAGQRVFGMKTGGAAHAEERLRAYNQLGLSAG